MRMFRVLLVIFFLAILAYTSVTLINYGPNLLHVFFADIKEMAWPGQFNFDFMCFLMLSGLWVSWRHHFTGKGIALGVLAFFGGIMFLAPYLYIVSLQCKDDMKAVMLGPVRASA